MATCFDRWEQDPFYPAAEEVQESADRMESLYRRWIRERSEAANLNNGTIDESNELTRDLRTAVGTTKWQLDELDRAVKLNDSACSVGKETRTRHKQFVDVIWNQISTVEKSLKESNHEKGEGEHSWVRWDEGERDQLALFLTDPLPPKDILERISGLRRTANSCGDIENSKFSLPDVDLSPNLKPSKIPSLSCLANALESTCEVTWPKNMVRKWKGWDHHQQDGFESIPLTDHQLSKGVNACYEKTKSCLTSSGQEAYDKQLYGWFGAFQRQLQRSQYQIQYGRPFQMILCALVLFIVFLAFVPFRGAAA